MRSVSIRLCDLERATIPIGFAGENLHTKINIDCMKMFEEYPTAIVSLTVKPPRGDAYPAVATRDGDIVTWEVTDSDLIYEGTGEIQLAFTVDEVIAKSYVGKTRIIRSIVPTGSIPTPIQNWIAQANEILEGIPGEISDEIAEQLPGEVAEQLPGAVADLIDDTAGYNVTDKTWSANKLKRDFNTKADRENPVIDGTLIFGRGNETMQNTMSVPAWAQNTAYKKFDLVSGDYDVATQLYIIYACKQDHTSGSTFDLSKWEEVGASDTRSISYKSLLEAVGSGWNVDGLRRNVRQLDWDGNEELAGDLTVFAGTNDETSISSLKNAITQKYEKPSGGIPSTDMTSAVQTSLGKADTAYQKPGTGVPSTDMASAVQTSLGKADTAYQKPSGGIPKTDLASAVQTSLGKADTALQGQDVTTAVDAYLTANFSNPSNPPLDRSLASSSSAAPADLVGDLKGEIYTTTFNGALVANETDKYVNNNGTVSTYTGFDYSELIPVKKGDKITAILACPTNFYAIWYGTENYATKETAVAGNGWTASELTLISDRDGYIFFNYYYSQPHTATIISSNIVAIEKDITELQQTASIITPIITNQTIPTHESGKYLTLGSFNINSFYSYSDAIPIKKGDMVTISAYIGTGVSCFYCASDLNFREIIFFGDTYAVKDYTFISDRTGYIAINFATDYTHTIKIIANQIARNSATNPLLNKTVLWCGDSIMRGNTFNDSLGGWAGRCANILSFNYTNYGVGGSTICNNVPGGATPTIYDQIETAYTEYPNADYIIFDGGCNDADLIGSVIGGTIPQQFGSFSPTDWSGTYNTDTFCGAFETICMHLSKYWLGKHFGYIIPQKQGVTNNYSAASNNRRAYYETAIQICKKWGISVLNFWDDCYLNPNHSWMCDTNNTMTQQEIYDAGFLYADRQHLTAEGYEYESSIVAEWLRSL